MLDKIKILCLKNGDSREHLSAPFVNDGYTYTTNGHCLLRIKGELVENAPNYKYPKFGKIDLSKLGELQNGIKPDIDKLKRIRDNNECYHCHPQSKQNPKVCRECDGEGEVTLCNEYNDYEIECKSCLGDGTDGGKYIVKDCPYCHGTRMSDEVLYHEEFFISEIRFNPQTVFLLATNLNNIEFFTDTKICDGGYGFRFDGGDGVLMEAYRRRTAQT